MTDSLRARIAAVHQAHRWGVFRCDDGYARTCCRCQWRETSDGPTHAEHVADAVIRELNLQPETLCTSGGAILSRLDGKVLADNRRMTRWATPWECDESPVK